MTSIVSVFYADNLGKKWYRIACILTVVCGGCTGTKSEVDRDTSTVETDSGTGDDPDGGGQWSIMGGSVRIIEGASNSLEIVQPQITIDGAMAIVTLGGLYEPLLRVATFPVEEISPQKTTILHLPDNEAAGIDVKGRKVATYVLDGKWLTQAVPYESAGTGVFDRDLLLVVTDPLTGESQAYEYNTILPVSFEHGFNSFGELDGEGRLVLGALGVINFADPDGTMGTPGDEILAFSVDAFGLDGSRSRIYESEVDWVDEVASGQLVCNCYGSDGRTFVNGSVASHVEVAGSTMVAVQVDLSGTLRFEPKFSVSVDSQLPIGQDWLLRRNGESAVAKTDDGFVGVAGLCFRNPEADGEEEESFGALWSMVLDLSGNQVVAPTLVETTTDNCVIGNSLYNGLGGMAWNGEWLGWCHRDLAPSNRVVFRLLDSLGRQVGTKRVLHRLDAAGQDPESQVNCDVAALSDGRFLAAFTVAGDVYATTIVPSELVE